MLWSQVWLIVGVLGALVLILGATVVVQLHDINEALSVPKVRTRAVPDPAEVAAVAVSVPPVRARKPQTRKAAPKKVAATPDAAATTPVVKRGPGRPRKVQDASAAPVKRAPGRPRKATATAPAKRAPRKAAATTVKRGPGRPRNTTT
jgi:hypothetical protein